MKTSKFITLGLLGLLFLADTYVIYTLEARPLGLPDLALLALAASFVGRAVAYLEIFEWLRYPFTKVVKHPSGIGETVEARADMPGPVQAVGGLVSCMVCAGAWAGEILYGLYTTTQWGETLVRILAVASAAWLVSGAVETLEWVKAHHWEDAGYTRQTNIRSYRKDGDR